MDAKKTYIAMGAVALVFVSAVLVLRNTIKKRGYSNGKLTAKLFKVPYLEKDGVKTYISDDAKENKLMQENPEFR